MSLQKYAAHQGAGSSSQNHAKLKIVVDTSVLVSALFFGGKAEATLRHIATHHELIVSDYIIDELIHFAKHTLPKTPQRTIRLIRQTLDTYSRVHEVHEVTVRDIHDTPIMQLAIEYSAIVITSDKDLLEHSTGATPPVLSIDEYGELFAQGK